MDVSRISKIFILEMFCSLVTIITNSKIYPRKFLFEADFCDIFKLFSRKSHIFYSCVHSSPTVTKHFVVLFSSA